jgi:hypothetical protein
VTPKALIADGFVFDHPVLERALRFELSEESAPHA